MKLSAEQIKNVLAEKMIPGLVIPDHDAQGHHYIYTPTQMRCDSVTTQSGILDMPHLKKWAANEAVKFIDKNWSIITPENKADMFQAAIFAHQDLFEDSGQVGTAGHNVIERYLKQWIATNNKPGDIRAFIGGLNDTRATAISRSAEMFFNDFEIIPLASELLVFSQKFKFGGTLDALAMIGKTIEKGMQTLPGMEPCKHEAQLIISNSGRICKCMACGRKVQYFFALLDFKTSNSIIKPEYPMQVSAYWQGLYEMTGLRPEMLIIIQLNKDRGKYNAMLVTDRVASFRAFKHLISVNQWLNNGKDKLAPFEPKTIISL